MAREAGKAGLPVLLLVAWMAGWAVPQPLAAQQESLPTRLSAWEAMAPAERDAARVQMRAWLRLPPLQQAALRASAAAFDQLSAEQQAALRLQFASLSAQQQHGWRLGAALGPYYPRLHPLMAYVPEAQRIRLLNTLHAMPPQELELLGRLAFSTPPAGRDALREALVRQPAAQRIHWLMAELDR